MQVLSPTTGLEKLQLGQQVTITWRTDGLTLERPVALIDAGGGPVDDFSADTGQTDGGTYTVTTTSAIDLSGVTDPATQAVWQTEASADYFAGNSLSYHLAVPDGVYTVQLDFAELQELGVGQRVFNIELQGNTVLPDYDIVADAGGDFIATAKSFTVTASGGAGINISLVNVTDQPAVLAGIEVYAANPLGVANPTVHIDLSANGGATWTPIATGLSMDQYGQGSYEWTIPTTLTTGNDYLVRVTADEGTDPVGVSNEPFLIANNGNNYYVSPSGNDANSGKSPDQPMASLKALLAAYTMEPGSVIHVDMGTYDLANNIVLGPQDSGVTIEGPQSGGAVFDRGNTNPGAYDFDLQGATNVTLDYLQITGGYEGVNASAGAGSSNLTVANSVLYDNESLEAEIDAGNDNPTFVNDTIYGGGLTNLFGVGGLDIASNAAMVTGNTVFDNAGTGIDSTGNSAQISNNTVYGNSAYGIWATGPGSLVSGNLVFDNNVDILAGILTSDTANVVTISGNSVYGAASALGIEIYGDNGVVTGNIVHDISGDGIEAGNSSVVADNQVYHNTADGIQVGSFTTVTGNYVYANNIGIEIDSAFGALVSNNILEGNASAGIHIATQPNLDPDPVQVINNTIIQETGNAIQVDTRSTDVQLSNNILWAKSGYDISVAPDSEVGFQSDYNDLYTTGTGAIGLWEGQSFSNLADWYYALGLDQHSISSDPQFVSPAAADGVPGFSTEPVGTPQIIDTENSIAFSTSGSWSTQTGGYGGTYLTAPAGDGSTTATWTFNDLTPGDTYEVAVTVPDVSLTLGFSAAFDAPFTVFDGGQPIGVQSVDEFRRVKSRPSRTTVPAYQVLGYFKMSGTTLTVVLRTTLMATVVADAAWVQQDGGNNADEDNFELLSTSPAVDAGDPNSPSLEEPFPNGGRVDMGAFGNTPQATSSPAQRGAGAKSRQRDLRNTRSASR